MRFPDQEPPKRAKHRQWQFETVEAGSFFNAWLADKPMWLNCHFIGRSIPCYWYMTGGKLQCPYCLTCPVITNQGFVPLFRDTYREVFVIVQERFKDFLAKTKVYTPMYVWRIKGDGNGVALRKSDWSKPWVPPADGFSLPSFGASLLNVFKEKKLKEWFAENGEPTEASPAAAVSPRTAGDPPPSSPVGADNADAEWAQQQARMQSVKERLGLRESSPISETLDGVTRDIARRAAAEIGTKPNGKHPAGKGGAK